MRSLARRRDNHGDDETIIRMAGEDFVEEQIASVVPPWAEFLEPSACLPGSDRVVSSWVSKASPVRRPTVCLLFSHPLVQAEFERLLSPRGFKFQSRRLETTLVPGLEPLSLPRAQVYVIDAHAPRQATEVLVAGIHDRYPSSRQLVVAEKFSESSAFALLRLGAKGLLSYAEARRQLPEALGAVAAGGFWVPRPLLSRFVDSILSIMGGHKKVKGPADLSRREREVLDPLLENLSNKEIASKLHISERTVKFHVSSLLSKFGVRRRSDLILLCFQARPPAP